MKYELVLLLNQEAELKEIESLISTLKGKVEKTDKWGEKTLAYTIKKNHRALFFVLTFTIEEKQTKELKKKLNYNEKIIRHLLLTVE